MITMSKVSFDSWLNKDCFLPFYSKQKQNTNDINKVNIVKRCTAIKNMLLKSYYESNMVTYQDTLIPMLVPNLLNIVVIATTSLKITNSILSKLVGKVSYMDHKRTWQEVPNALLPYLYNKYIVYTHNKYAYYHKMNYSLICDIWTLGTLLEV